jgi:hypothetical protein
MFFLLAKNVWGGLKMPTRLLIATDRRALRHKYRLRISRLGEVGNRDNR